MPWQKYVAARALEIDPATGELAYDEVRLTVPRQSGKTTLMFAASLQRAMDRIHFVRRQQIVYLAQTGKEARKKWELDWLPEIKESRTLRDPANVRVHRATGHEGFSFPRTSSRFSLAATTKKSAHGGTIDLGFIDEAFAQPDDRMEQALKPAMSTRRSPQLWIVSTAGDMTSRYLRGKVLSGRKLAEAGITEGVCYFEWSADDDADPGDPATWWSCMPALGITQTERFVASTYQSMRDGAEIEPGIRGIDGFRRAYLNIWVQRTKESPIPLDAMAACTLPAGPPPIKPLVLGVDVSPDRGMGSIAVAGRMGRMPRGDLAESRPGTGWMLARVIEMDRKHSPRWIVLDPASPASSLIPGLKKAGLGRKLHLMTPQEMGQACGGLYEATVATPPTWCRGPSDVLDAALANAVSRPIGDGGWAFARRSSAGDISSLVALTAAMWGLSALPESAGVWGFFS